MRTTIYKHLCITMLLYSTASFAIDCIDRGVVTVHSVAEGSYSMKINSTVSTTDYPIGKVLGSNATCWKGQRVRANYPKFVCESSQNKQNYCSNFAPNLVGQILVSCPSVGTGVGNGTDGRSSSKTIYNCNNGEIDGAGINA